jgi:uncharacterized protein YukE
MAGTMSALSLPAFSYAWVGGDIRGLSALAGQCYQIVPQITAVDSALSRQVSQLTSDGGWKGATANAFSSAWDKDSATGRQLAGAWEDIGAVVDDLAVELAALESALEEAAREAEAYGVGIDVAGQVAPEITAQGLTGAAAQAAANQWKVAGEYNDFRQATLDRATAVRAAAAAKLENIAQAMLPPRNGGRDWGQGVDVADGLRGLWSIPTLYRQGLEEELPELEQNLAQTERSAMWELIQTRKLLGNAAQLSGEAKANLRAAFDEENTMESKLASIENLETTSSKLAAGDADGIAGLGDSADGLAALGTGLVRAIPFAGTTVAAGITIYQDREQGESWGHSIADGVVSSAAALGAALAVAAGAAALIGTSEVWAVGVGVVATSLAAVGVGYFVHDLFQENWAADIHKYGVLGGTTHGVADSYDETRHDMAHLADDVAHPVEHVAKHLWDDIF